MLPKTNEYINRAYENACKHGFHDKNLSIEHYLMLIITEVSEMVEAHRKDRYADVLSFVEQEEICSFEDRYVSYIKGSVEEEMADVCIRLYDLAGDIGMKFSKNTLQAQSHISWTKELLQSQEFTKKAFHLCEILATCGEFPLEGVICAAICYVEQLAKDLNIELEWHIEQKMKYNETRPKLHGKKY